MLEFLYSYPSDSDRKRRLFAVACCRRIWLRLIDEKSRKAVEVAERYADGNASEAELHTAQVNASGGLGHCGGDDDSWGRDSFPAGMEGTAKAAAWAVTWGCGEDQVSDAAATAAAPSWADRPPEWAKQANFLRDIFGLLPFRPTSLNPSWLAWNDGSIPKKAQVIYDDRAFDRLPLLADALEEAGCDNQDILDHCRSAGEHVRGCWVVDLLLGRS